MDPAERQELEKSIRHRCEDGDFAGAAALAVRGYGPEIFGLLVTIHRSEQDASDVFSIFVERMWRGLEGFAWECSFRTWAYTVARNASRNYLEDARRRARFHPPLQEGSALSAIAAEVRTATRSYLKTEKRSAIAKLRESLSAEDQMLLSLRIDRQLAWSELARVMYDGDEPLAEDVLKRESARLRKRFQTIKDKLAELARRHGILDRS